MGLLPSNTAIFKTLRALQASSIPRFLDFHAVEFLHHLQWVLKDKELNVCMAPDMLGLIFASLSLGAQFRMSHQVNTEKQMFRVENSQSRADCYRELQNTCIVTKY